MSAIVLVGCSGTEPLAPDASIDASKQFHDAPSMAPLMLSSPALAPGDTFRTDNTCDGQNVSPTLIWQNPPLGTASFGIVLRDKADGTLLWVIYDVPAVAVNVPPAVMNAYAPTNMSGAHQTVSWQGTTRGYRGPCPTTGDPAHAYEFSLYALDVASLPGASTGTTRDMAYTTITQHQLAVATLDGTYQR